MTSDRACAWWNGKCNILFTAANELAGTNYLTRNPRPDEVAPQAKERP
jgi:hypothetical protein